MIIAEAIRNTFKKWTGVFRQKEGVKLQFKNSSENPILSLRVVIGDDVHEFRGIEIGAHTTPLILPKSNLYFFSYVVTPFEKLYFEPTNHQLERIIKSGLVLVSIFIAPEKGGKSKILMYPKISAI